MASWAWALSIVNSRALIFKGVRFLVPIADLVNHRTHIGAWMREVEHGNFFLKHHVLSTSGLHTSSDRNFAPGYQFLKTTVTTQLTFMLNTMALSRKKRILLTVRLSSFLA